MPKPNYSDAYETISALLLTISKGEQIQQCIRQVMTSHPLFNPFSLFKYISKNNTVIKKQHLQQFLTENNQNATEEQVKVILLQTTGKKSWQYSDFLEVIYPFNSAVLREITNLHLKRYKQLEKYTVNESTLTSFLMLLTQKIQINRKLQIQKEDSFVNISKQNLNKILLSIKKLGDKQLKHCQNDASRITSLQLRNFLKTFVSVEQSHFLYLTRRLGMVNGSFLIESLEKLIKPKKTKHKKIKQHQTNQKNLNDKKQNFNQKSYKQQLLQQLSQSIHLRQSKRQNKQQKISEQKFNNYSSSKKVQQNRHSPLKQYNLPRHQANNKYIAYEQHSQIENAPQQLFVQFIQAYLPFARQLETLKIKVVQQKVDFLALFKKIDKTQRGVATADDLYHYYINAGGLMSLSTNEFQLIIEKYGQSQDPWLSFAQFCDMVRAEDKEAFKKIQKFKQNQQLLIIRILQLYAKCQISILKISRKFKNNQVRKLFKQINRQKTGFINYQELKKFLVDEGLSLSMHDLMILLKRLDKGRNGVIIEQEFITHFQPRRPKH